MSFIFIANLSFLKKNSISLTWLVLRWKKEYKYNSRFLFSQTYTSDGKNGSRRIPETETLCMRCPLHRITSLVYVKFPLHWLQSLSHKTLYSFSFLGIWLLLRLQPHLALLVHHLHLHHSEQTDNSSVTDFLSQQQHSRKSSHDTVKFVSLPTLEDTATSTSVPFVMIQLSQWSRHQLRWKNSSRSMTFRM